MRWRIVIVAVWLTVQLALILTGPRRPSGAFAFRMFPETSDVEIRLWRITGGRREELPMGVWTARGHDGKKEVFSWLEMVAPFGPAHIDSPSWASYGARAQLEMLQAALDWVARNTPGDAETTLLGADVTVWTNGHAPYVAELRSVRR